VKTGQTEPSPVSRYNVSIVAETCDLTDAQRVARMSMDFVGHFPGGVLIEPGFPE